MIVHPAPTTRLDTSAHRALWALLPARAQRRLTVLRPLSAMEAPAPVSRVELLAAAVFLITLVALQQWVWLCLLAAALMSMPSCRRALTARAQRNAAAQQKVKQEEEDERALAESLEINCEEALAAIVMLYTQLMIITIIIMSALSYAIASICKCKRKSININLTKRIFGQQLAGAAIQ